MAKWQILREPPNPDYNPESDPLSLVSVFAPTGEVYDDSLAGRDTIPLSIDDYLTLREIEDGWEYGAESA